MSSPFIHPSRSQSLSLSSMTSKSTRNLPLSMDNLQNHQNHPHDINNTINKNNNNIDMATIMPISSPSLSSSSPLFSLLEYYSSRPSTSSLSSPLRDSIVKWIHSIQSTIQSDQNSSANPLLSSLGFSVVSMEIIMDNLLKETEGIDMGKTKINHKIRHDEDEDEEDDEYHNHDEHMMNDNDNDNDEDEVGDDDVSVRSDIDDLSDDDNEMKFDNLLNFSSFSSSSSSSSASSFVGSFLSLSSLLIIFRHLYFILLLRENGNFSSFGPQITQRIFLIFFKIGKNILKNPKISNQKEFYGIFRTICVVLGEIFPHITKHIDKAEVSSSPSSSSPFLAMSEIFDGIFPLSLHHISPIRKLTTGFLINLIKNNSSKRWETLMVERIKMLITSEMKKENETGVSSRVRSPETAIPFQSSLIFKLLDNLIFFVHFSPNVKILFSLGLLAFSSGKFPIHFTFGDKDADHFHLQYAPKTPTMSKGFSPPRENSLQLIKILRSAIKNPIFQFGQMERTIGNDSDTDTPLLTFLLSVPFSHIDIQSFTSHLLGFLLLFSSHVHFSSSDRFPLDFYVKIISQIFHKISFAFRSPQSEFRKTAGNFCAKIIQNVGGKCEIPNSNGNVHSVIQHIISIFELFSQLLSDRFAPYFKDFEAIFVSLFDTFAHFAQWETENPRENKSKKSIRNLIEQYYFSIATHSESPPCFLALAHRGLSYILWESPSLLNEREHLLTLSDVLSSRHVSLLPLLSLGGQRQNLKIFFDFFIPMAMGIAKRAERQNPKEKEKDKGIKGEILNCAVEELEIHIDREDSSSSSSSSSPVVFGSLSLAEISLFISSVGDSFASNCFVPNDWNTWKMDIIGAMEKIINHVNSTKTCGDPCVLSLSLLQNLLFGWENLVFSFTKNKEKHKNNKNPNETQSEHTAHNDNDKEEEDDEDDDDDSVGSSHDSPSSSPSPLHCDFFHFRSLPLKISKTFPLSTKFIYPTWKKRIQRKLKEEEEEREAGGRAMGQVKGHGQRSGNGMDLDSDNDSVMETEMDADGPPPPTHSNVLTKVNSLSFLFVSRRFIPDTNEISTFLAFLREISSALLQRIISFLHSNSTSLPSSLLIQCLRVCKQLSPYCDSMQINQIFTSLMERILSSMVELSSSPRVQSDSVDDSLIVMSEILSSLSLDFSDKQRDIMMRSIHHHVISHPTTQTQRIIQKCSYKLLRAILTFPHSSLLWFRKNFSPIMKLLISSQMATHLGAKRNRMEIIKKTLTLTTILMREMIQNHLETPLNVPNSPDLQVTLDQIFHSFIPQVLFECLQNVKDNSRRVRILAWETIENFTTGIHQCDLYLREQEMGRHSGRVGNILSHLSPVSSSSPSPFLLECFYLISAGLISTDNKVKSSSLVGLSSLLYSFPQDILPVAGDILRPIAMFCESNQRIISTAAFGFLKVCAVRMGSDVLQQGEMVEIFMKTIREVSCSPFGRKRFAAKLKTLCEILQTKVPNEILTVYVSDQMKPIWRATQKERRKKIREREKHNEKYNSKGNGKDKSQIHEKKSPSAPLAHFLDEFLHSEDLRGNEEEDKEEENTNHNTKGTQSKGKGKEKGKGNGVGTGKSKGKGSSSTITFDENVDFLHVGNQREMDEKQQKQDKHKFPSSFSTSPTHSDHSLSLFPTQNHKSKGNQKMDFSSFPFMEHDKNDLPFTGRNLNERDTQKKGKRGREREEEEQQEDNQEEEEGEGKEQKNDSDNDNDHVHHQQGDGVEEIGFRHSSLTQRKPSSSSSSSSSFVRLPSSSLNKKSSSHRFSIKKFQQIIGAAKRGAQKGNGKFPTHQMGQSEKKKISQRTKDDGDVEMRMGGAGEREREWERGRGRGNARKKVKH